MAEARAAAAAREFNPWPAAVFASLVMLALLFLAPTVGVLLSSIKTTRDIAFGNLWAVPDRLYLGNFAEVLFSPAVHQYFVNTLLVTVPATAASLALGVLAGYVFSKLPFRGSNLLFLALVSGMFFPPQVILIPLFRLFNSLDLIDTLWPIIFVHTALGIPICTLLMRNFFATVPNALREAAILAGANEWQVLTRVALPLSLPALAVLATLQFTWNLERLPLAADIHAVGREADDHDRDRQPQGPVLRRLGRAGGAVAGRQRSHADRLPVLPAVLHQGNDHGRGQRLSHGGSGVAAGQQVLRRHGRHQGRGP